MIYWTTLFRFNLGNGRIYLETLAQKLLLTVSHNNVVIAGEGMELEEGIEGINADEKNKMKQKMIQKI